MTSARKTGGGRRGSSYYAEHLPGHLLQVGVWVGVGWADGRTEGQLWYLPAEHLPSHLLRVLWRWDGS